MYFCFIVRLYYQQGILKLKRDFMKLYLTKTDTFLLESLMHDVIQRGALKKTSANNLTATSTL